MSNGGAQATVFTIPAYASFKLYHYAAGGSVDKNIWTDEGKTTPAAQPMIADANGVIQFYADGDYRFVIDDSGDVNRYDWDDYKVTSDTGGMWEGNQGTEYAAATAANTGQPFAKIDGAGTLRGFAINQGDEFIETYQANESGDQTLNSIVTKTTPVYNVTHGDWGAVGDGVTDDTEAVQKAITAIEIAGKGILYFPTGVYVINGSLDINNTAIYIKGDGAGLTYLNQKVNPAAPMIDFDTNNVWDTFILRGISFTTQVAASNTAIDCFWVSTAGTDSQRNVIMEDVACTSAGLPPFTGYFSDCIKVSDAKRGIFRGLVLAGADGASSEQGITFDGYSVQNIMSDYTFSNMAEATRVILNSTNCSQNYFNGISGGGVSGAVYTVASASSLAIPPEANVFWVTGTTGITQLSSINGAQEGRVAYFIMAASVTWSDGAGGTTLELAGNFNATVDDVLCLVWRIGRWREVSRSAN